MSRPKFRVKKGDKVAILAGKDKGAQGEVIDVITSESRVVVQGVNLVTKHQKPSQFSAGGLQKKEMPVHVSNVALLDPKDNKPTRVGYKILKDGTKVRVAKRSGETIE